MGIIYNSLEIKLRLFGYSSDHLYIYLSPCGGVEICATDLSLEISEFRTIVFLFYAMVIKRIEIKNFLTIKS